MNKVYMEEMSVKFFQDADCSQNQEDYQDIEFHLENNGVGNFIWIKTDRWSFSSIEDLQKLVDRVRAMEEANNKIEGNHTNKT